MVTVAQNDRIRIDRLELGLFGTNAYVLTCRETHDSVVVDAPGEVSRVLAVMEGTHPRYILITHSHLDHIGGLSDLKAALAVPVAAHAADAGDLPVAADILLEDADSLSFGAIRLTVLHTAGHTRGSICFLTDNYLISGDTVFPGGPGRTGSPADFRRILDSIARRILTLPGNTQIYPGHGEATTVERQRQAFADFSARPHDPGLCGDVVWES